MPTGQLPTKHRAPQNNTAVQIFFRSLPANSARASAATSISEAFGNRHTLARLHAR